MGQEVRVCASRSTLAKTMTEDAVLLFDGANRPPSQRGLARRVFRAALVSGPVCENEVRSAARLTGPRTPARWVGRGKRCHPARDKKEGNGFLKFLKRKKKKSLSFAVGFGVPCQDQRVRCYNWFVRGSLRRACPDRLCPCVEPAAWLTSRANNSFCYSTVLLTKAEFFDYFAGAFRALVLYNMISFLFF